MTHRCYENDGTGSNALGVGAHDGRLGKGRKSRRAQVPSLYMTEMAFRGSRHDDRR